MNIWIEIEKVYKKLLPNPLLDTSIAVADAFGIIVLNEYDNLGKNPKSKLEQIRI